MRRCFPGYRRHDGEARRPAACSTRADARSRSAARRHREPKSQSSRMSAAAAPSSPLTCSPASSASSSSRRRAASCSAVARADRASAATRLGFGKASLGGDPPPRLCPEAALESATSWCRVPSALRRCGPFPLRCDGRGQRIAQIADLRVAGHDDVPKPATADAPGAHAARPARVPAGSAYGYPRGSPLPPGARAYAPRRTPREPTSPWRPSGSASPNRHRVCRPAARTSPQRADSRSPWPPWRSD